MFIHPPKTGGMSVWKSLVGDTAITKENYWKLGDWNHYHLSYPSSDDFVKLIKSDGRCVISLRDPVEQCISAYNSQRYNMVVLEEDGAEAVVRYGMMDPKLAEMNITGLRHLFEQSFDGFDPRKNQLKELLETKQINFYNPKDSYRKLIMKLMEDYWGDIYIIEQENLELDIENKLNIKFMGSENLINYGEKIEIVDAIDDEMMEMFSDQLEKDYEAYYHILAEEK